MNNRKKSSRLQFPEILAGSWKGEIAGKPHVHFGQQTQPGKPRRSVEFSSMMLPVTLVLSISGQRPIKQEGSMVLSVLVMDKAFTGKAITALT